MGYGGSKRALKSTQNDSCRVGDFKLLVDCFNTTTLSSTGQPPELYNIAQDPYETHNLAASSAAKVAELTARLVEYAKSTDQVPPIAAEFRTRIATKI